MSRLSVNVAGKVITVIDNHSCGVCATRFINKKSCQEYIPEYLLGDDHNAKFICGSCAQCKYDEPCYIADDTPNDMFILYN